MQAREPTKSRHLPKRITAYLADKLSLIEQALWSEFKLIRQQLTHRPAHNFKEARKEITSILYDLSQIKNYDAIERKDEAIKKRLLIKPEAEQLIKKYKSSALEKIPLLAQQEAKQLKDDFLASVKKLARKIQTRDKLAENYKETQQIMTELDNIRTQLEELSKPKDDLTKAAHNEAELMKKELETVVRKLQVTEQPEKREYPDSTSTDLAMLKQKLRAFKKKILPEMLEIKIPDKKEEKLPSKNKEWNKKIARMKTHLKHAEKKCYYSKGQK